MIWVWLASLSLGMLASRTTTVLARGGIVNMSNAGVTLGFFGTISTFVLVIVGFWLFAWWVPIVAFLGVSIATGLIAVGDRLIFLYKTAALQNLAAIGGAGYLGWQAWLA